MDLAMITTRQVASLFLLILAGYVAAKAGALKDEAKKGFSDLLVYLVVPAMILDSYLKPFDPETFSNLIDMFALSTVLLLAGMLITLLFTRRFEEKHRAILRFACMFPNAGYMGFPLIEALFGSEGLLYASAFVTVFNLLLWTVGYAIVSRQARPREILRSIVTTPALIAVAAGIFIYLMRIPVPEVLSAPIGYLGSMNTPLSMIITGMLIAQIDLRAMLRRRTLLGVIGIRQIAIPAVCLVITALSGLKGMVPQIALLLEVCPCAAITSVFAVRFSHDGELAAGSVVLTTLLSIIVLPACALLLSAIC